MVQVIAYRPLFKAVNLQFGGNQAAENGKIGQGGNFLLQEL
jgi:hypothetical protein